MNTQSKWFLPLVIVGVLAVAIMSCISIGNRLVSLDEGVNAAWSQVQNVYQRRMDVIPNLVETVKGYAKHEQAVFENVTKARAQVGQVNIQGPKSMEEMKQFEQAQTGLSSALSRLLVVSEKYPDLKADKNFLELQSQIEGTENRITVERQRFNQVAQVYNTAIRQFPSSWVASLKGMVVRPYFEAQKGADVAPQVKF
jgi:LemA protein